MMIPSDEWKPWDGRPENPERDGWHWLSGNGGEGRVVDAACWCARRCVWFIQGNDDPMRADQMITRGWLSYLGPCLLPSEHAALLAWGGVLRARVEEAQASAIAVVGELKERVEALEAALVTARREAAEVIREKAKVIAMGYAAPGRIDAIGSHEELLRSEGRRDCAEEIAAEIGDLSLPGDEAQQESIALDAGSQRATWRALSNSTTPLPGDST